MNGIQRIDKMVRKQMNFPIIGPSLGMSSACAPILRSLPNWFGIEAANIQYLQDIDVLPTWVALCETESVGFLTIKEHNPYAAEIHVMGVYPHLHRQGVGWLLVAKVEEDLRQRGFEFLQVKTLSASHPDEGYARTRAFYLACGFRPLEEFPGLWGPENPCLQMIKSLN